jgi:hypothetical protein
MENKKCCTCEKTLPLTEFNKNKRRYDGLQTHCRECQKEKSRKYYAANKPKMVRQIMERKWDRIKTHQEKLYEYLLSNPCVDCGESDPRVLEFDHQRDKSGNVADFLRGGYSWERIVEEIDKCEVRCANCHRRKTAINFGYYRHRLSEKTS